MNADEINRFAPQIESMNDAEVSEALRRAALRFPDDPMGALLKTAADRIGEKSK